MSRPSLGIGRHIALVPLLALALRAAPAGAQDEAPAPPERLSFSDAVQRGLAQSPSFMVARANVARALALVKEARGAWLPTVSGNFVLTQLEGPRPEADLPATQENLNLAVTVPVVSTPQWARTWQADDNLKIAQSNEKDVRRQVATAVAKAYLSILTQHRLIEVSQQAVTTAEAHYKYTHERYAQGLGNNIDVLRAQTEMATSESQLQTAETGLIQLQEALGVLTASDHPIDTTEIPDLPAAPVLGDALKEVKDRRADLLALETRLSTAHEEDRRAWADYIPLLGAVFAPFLQNPAIPSTPAKGFEAQVLLTIPLYDGGVRYGLQGERDALVVQSTGVWENALRQASADVRSAFQTVRQTDKVLHTTQEAARLASKTLELTTLAYKTGAIDDLQVIDAERQARDSDSAVVIAEDGSRQARLDLLSASGRFPDTN